MKKVEYKIGGKKGKKIQLLESDNLMVVRTFNNKSILAALESEASKEIVKKFKVKDKSQHKSISILEVKADEKSQLKVRNDARKLLKQESNIRFAGRVLVDETSKEPVLYSENIYIKFQPNITQAVCYEILKKFQLTIKRELSYEANAYFVQAKEGTGMKVFTIVEKLLALKEILVCEPELLRAKGKKKVQLNKSPIIHNKQWHLKETLYKSKPIKAHCFAEDAHKLTLGEGITIAVIDDGIDITHPEFNIDGKLIAGINIDTNLPNPMPSKKYENHGTQCAGVACASGQFQCAGVAPAAVLMPIRSNAYLGSQNEAYSFIHAVENGADIISCSWGPEDGVWYDPEDLLHNQVHELSDRVKDAIHYAVTKGRKGKGCIVLFAAGNGNESADNDHYISNKDIVGVAACNDTNTRSIYSDYGKSIWVCFPSNDFDDSDHPAPITPGIWTTDRVGKKGESPGNYSFEFGGTSSACPGVAGVCALILSANPSLTAKQVKKILKDTADKIDVENGKYKKNGHSMYYGYGRVNALNAVKMAIKMKK